MAPVTELKPGNDNDMVTDSQVVEIVNASARLSGTDGNRQLTILAMALITACMGNDVPKRTMMTILDRGYDELARINHHFVATDDPPNEAPTNDPVAG